MLPEIWKRLKLLVAYVYLRLMKRKIPPLFTLNYKSSDLRELGVTSPPQSWFRENPRSLLPNEHAVDALHIWGADHSGNALLIRVWRRPDRTSEVFVYLKLKSGEEYVLPHQPDMLTYDTDGKSFAARGLYFEVLEPLRRWRVGFNGVLRKGLKNDWDTEDGETVSTQFNFIWHPMFNFTGFPLDFDVRLQSELLAKQKWTLEFLKSFNLSSTEWHEQWGQLHGNLTINRKDHTLLLNGSKTREYGIWNWNDVKRKVVIKGFTSKALGLNLYGETQSDGSVRIFHGEIHPSSNLKTLTVREADVYDVDKLFDGGALGPREVKIQLTAEKEKYRVKLLDHNARGCTVFAGRDWNCRGRIRFVHLEIDDVPGFALVETYQRHSGGSPLPKRESVRHLAESADVECHQLVVNFLDPACQCSAMVGGKGASLGLLASLRSSVEDFQVPSGLCLTKRSFERHVADHPDILAAICDLEDIAWKRTEGNINEACEKVTRLICRSRLSDHLRAKLKENLISTFGTAFEEKKFAVRSSAIGEDGEEMSAAGQNDTYLGVKSLDSLYASILRCWASQFSYRSVEYKRQNGQLLNGGMAIVVQEMVAADVAGVLFTKDPRDGNAEHITISSNFGLGESVVSSSADPDTILLKRHWNDELTVAETTIGKKKVAVVMKDDGVCEIDTDLNQSMQCSLSAEGALKLGRVAIVLERHFGSARDIEWAVKGDSIYLLQARPVTSTGILTDFEVTHEFDAAVKTSYEHYTNGNLAEVMPGASTPLNLSIYTRAQLIHFTRMSEGRIKMSRYDPTVVEGQVVFTNHVFFDLVGQKASSVGQKKGILAKSLDVGFYGRVMDDAEVLKIAAERYGLPSGDMKNWMLKMSLTGVFFAKRILKSAQKAYANYATPGADERDPHEIYRQICNSIMDVAGAMIKHLQVSFAGMLWNSALLSLISGGSEEFSQELFSDFATLVGSNNNCESGHVPYSLKELVDVILQQITPKEFIAMSPEEALTWLMDKNRPTSTKLQDFLKRHGHRGLKEFEVRALSWGMQPAGVVKILQTMIRHPSAVTQRTRLRKAIVSKFQSSKSRLSFFKRRLLDFVVNQCKNGVRNREEAKSYLINYMHSRRLAFRHLAKEMVHDGYVPDQELVFFMTLEEIGELLHTRSPRIIIRARLRKRVYPTMDLFKYPEISVGFPKPINDSKEEDIVGATQVVGVPVCHGIVKGTAKVVLTIHEVDCLEPEDILITYATDIGWSPYFPMLGGVVTEIGGLVSHGAVVAREYGLPCIISAENATRIFKTGDVVLMNATKGTVTKICN